jgi:hypothetical protein
MSKVQTLTSNYSVLVISIFILVMRENLQGIPSPKEKKRKRALLQDYEKFGGHLKNSVSHGM